MHSNKGKNRNLLKKVWGSAPLYLASIALVGCNKQHSGFREGSIITQTNLSGTANNTKSIINEDIEAIINNEKEADKLVKLAEKYEQLLMKYTSCAYMTLTILRKNETTCNHPLLQIIASTAEDFRQVHSFTRLLLEGFSLIAAETHQTYCDRSEIANALRSFGYQGDNFYKEVAAKIRNMRNKEMLRIVSIRKEKLEEVKRYLAVMEEIEKRVMAHMEEIGNRMAAERASCPDQVQVGILSYVKHLMKIIFRVRSLSNSFTKDVEEVLASEGKFTNWLASVYHRGVAFAQSSGVGIYEMYKHTAPIVAAYAQAAMHKGKEGSVYVAQGLWNQAKVVAPIVSQELWNATKIVVPMVGRGICYTTKVAAPIIGKGIVEAAKLNYYLARKGLEVIEHNMAAANSTGNI